jgi:hypothetical protein
MFEGDEMVQQSDIILQSDRFRAWVDQDNIGHIKILRRINFVTLIDVIRQIAEIQLRDTGQPGEVKIYIPASLRTICSENLRSFIEFTRICCDMKIAVMEAEEGGAQIK